MNKPDTSAADKPAHSTLKTLPPTEGADKIVQRNMYWAAGLGIIPIPLIDFATTTVVQIKMLRDLAEYYDIPFRAGLAKSAVAALVAGAASPVLGLGLVRSLLRAIPVVGSVVGALSGPVVAGALTYAVGKVFTLHFGSGGTLLDFNPERFRDYFAAQVEAGRKLVDERIRGGAPGGTAGPAAKPAL